MKAISIRQPWAWLIVQGYKDVENRTWRTNYRGPILIHASKSLDPDLPSLRRRFLQRSIRLPIHFHRGGIVGRARLVDCVPYHPSSWFEGPYGFVLTEAEPLTFIPLRGALYIFTVSLDDDTSPLVPQMAQLPLPILG